MENILGLIGTILGAAGLVLSVYVVRWQAKENAKELAKEREAHTKELEAQAKAQEVQAKELERTNRLIFLSDRIFDISIPRELRLPFYEEYISMKGNGTAVKFWLMEGEMKKGEK